MAKQNRTQRVAQVNSTHGEGSSFEQTESYDDSLLPDAGELARLKELDPEIIPWIKGRTEIEQDARLDFNSRKLKIVEDNTKRSYIFDNRVLLCVFIIVIASGFFSYFLLEKGFTVGGSVFAGGTLLMIIQAFFNFKQKRDPKK